MQLKAPNKNRFWANLMVEELVRSGVTTFFVAPGSRSTPLAMAVYDHPIAELIMHFDERGTAFMALGYGKSKGIAAGWITTSGTAVANGYPAIVEADLEATPMILLTGDRPPELRATDANQTIRQDHIFGSAVRWFFDVPPPTDSIQPEFVLTTIDQAVHRARTGPVHLNCMFREPLAPTDESYSPRISDHFQSWQTSGKPFTTYSVPAPTYSADQIALEKVLSASKKPLIVLGRMRGKGDEIAAAAETLAARFGAVFTSDISSQARLQSAPVENSQSLMHVDILLAGARAAQNTPDCIIQFGATPLSKRLSSWISTPRVHDYVVIDHRERRIDPSHSVSMRIETDPVAFLLDWAKEPAVQPTIPLTGQETALSQKRSLWQEFWQSFKAPLASWLNSEVLKGPLTEQAAATLLSRHVPQDGALTVGSSTPVRHMDGYADPVGRQVPVLTNRGASGIDGTVASAIGFAIGHKKRPIVFLGDLALLHDLNSLAMCAKENAVVVVINNNGGGIFSYLPVRGFEPQFEPLFGTPHGLGFESAAAMFNLTYQSPTTVEGYETALKTAFSQKKAFLIEIITDRDANLAESKRLKAVFQNPE